MRARYIPVVRTAACAAGRAGRDYGFVVGGTWIDVGVVVGGMCVVDATVVGAIVVDTGAAVVDERGAVVLAVPEE
jgi:hypothetical protein